MTHIATMWFALHKNNNDIVLADNYIDKENLLIRKQVVTKMHQRQRVMPSANSNVYTAKMLIPASKTDVNTSCKQSLRFLETKKQIKD